MTCPKIALLIIVFFTYLHPEFSKSSFLFQNFDLGSVGNSKKNQILRCFTKQIKEEEPMKTRFLSFFRLDTKENDPSEWIVLVGTNLTYKCCGNDEAIFRWGLYKKGEFSPSTLYSRVEITKTGSSNCLVSWTSHFQTSRYSGRTKVEYNTSSNCLLWILANVTKEDENTFVAVVRDNYLQGKGFRECSPIVLKVYEAETPPPTRSPVPKTTVKTPIEKPSHTTSGPYLPTSNLPSPTTQKPTPTTETITSSVSLGITLGIIIPITAIVIAAIIIRVKRKCWNKETVQKINIGEENDDKDCSQDNLLEEL